MRSRSVERRCSPSIAPVMFLVVLVALALDTANSMPYNTDCMKNPFASGCRGISAKRSTGLIWPPTTTDPEQEGQQNQLDGKAATRAHFYDLIAAHQANQLRSNQLSVVADLLMAATQRLANLAQWNALQASKRNQGMQDDGFGLSSALAAKRAIAAAKEGQREEAASR